MMRKKLNHHHEVEETPKKKRRKLPLFYKITFSILLIGFIAIFYFVVLVSTSPKSVSFVTHKINEILQEKLGSRNVALENSFISFTRYGTLKVAVTSLKIIYKAPSGIEEKSLIIPRLETEFSLLDFLLLRFQPVKIKIIDPNLMIDDLQNFQAKDSGESINSSGQFATLVAVLSSIRTGKSPIENIEIENAHLLFKGRNFDTPVLLKNSKIKASVNNKVLQISSQNKISFDEKKSDVDVGSSCQFFKHGNLKCDITIENFKPDSISGIHESFGHLTNIHAVFGANISFAFKEGEMDNIRFKLRSEKGDFEFVDFFGRKIEFSNFNASGEYDYKLKLLNLDQIETDLFSELAEKNNSIKPHLAMSLLISNLTEKAGRKLDFYIKIHNVLNDELEKFWPASLHEGGVRDWVIDHTSGGMIKNAYAKFSLAVTPENNQLESIDSEVVFSDLTLKYGEDFPEISSLAGIAKFSHHDMKISLLSGNVLNSKISEGLVAIDDFSAPQIFLKISGKAQGHGADSLKHANNSPEFMTEVEKYLNGNAQVNFDIRLPLADLTLKNSYIEVNSAIVGLKSDYVEGAVLINCKKDFNSETFVANADLTAAALVGKGFDVQKEMNVESGLSLIIDFAVAEKIFLKNVALWKKEEVKNDNKNIKPQFKTSKISANMVIATKPLALEYLDLKNNNFGKNNYDFTYNFDIKTALQKINLRAMEINFGSFIAEKLMLNSGNSNSTNLQIQIAANRAYLLQKKLLRGFYFAANCTGGICHNGIGKASYAKNQFINFNIVKNPKDDFSTIDGRISDLGYLAEGFGISNVIAGGDAQIKIQNKLIENKPVLEGKVTIKNNITIYETPTVKKLSKDDLFSRIKDKIFSMEKTTFDSMKIEFALQNSALDIKSFIANNYKIGITAKGNVDLKNSAYQFKGMIIPGFLINNLFGIGNIPILGNVVGLLTGGEGGGLFGLRYEYVKNKGQKEATFTTNKVTAFVPSSIQNLFD